MKTSHLIVTAATLSLSLALAGCSPDYLPARPDAPEAPINLVSLDVTTTSATLRWDAIPEIDTYNVKINGEIYAVTSAVYEAKELTPEAAYIWSVQSVDGDLTSVWSDVETFFTTAEPVAIPAGLETVDVTRTSATLVWEPVEGATAYEVVFRGAIEPAATTLQDPVVVKKTSYAVSELNYETEYTWTVRAVEYTKKSEWAAEVDFFPLGPVQMPYISGDYYGDDYFNGTNLFYLGLSEFDLMDRTTPRNGRTVWIEVITAGSVGADRSKEFFDIPVGAYEVKSQGWDPAPSTINAGSFTEVIDYVDDDVAGEAPISTGTVTISGDHTNYKILVDVILGNGEEVFVEYNGAMPIENPRYIPPTPDADMGTLPTIYSLGYFPDGYEDGTVDVWILNVFGEGLSESGGYYQGSGWSFNTLLHGPLNSGSTIPNGTYNILPSFDPGTALYGWSSPNGPAGTWAFLLENGQFKEQRALKSGTITSTYSGGQYTIVIDAVDANGAKVTGAVRAAPPTR